MNPSVKSALSADLCTVEEELEGHANSAEVFHVLEPFGNRPALRRIGELLARLFDATDVRLLCMEAATGPISREVLLAQARAKGGEADSARIESGELSYLEYLALRHGGPLDVHGVEDREAYLRTLDAGRPLMVSRDEWASRMRGLRARLLRDGLSGLSAEYRQLLGRTTPAAGQGDHDEDELPPIENVLEDAAACGVDLTLFRQFRLLIEVKALENRIDFEVAQTESLEVQQLVVAAMTDRENLIRVSFEKAGFPAATLTPRRAAALMRGGDVPTEVLAAMDRTPLGLLLHSGAAPGTADVAKPDLWALFERTQAGLEAEFRRLLSVSAQAQTAGEQGPDQQTLQIAHMRRLMAFTLDMFPLLGVQPDRFPNFVRYTHYLTRFSQLDMASALKDLEAVSERILQATARSELDRVHASLMASLSALGRLFALETTPALFGWLLAHASELDHRTVCGGLAKCLGGEAAVGELASLAEATDDRFDDCMRYYALMMERGNAMARNTLAAMRERGLDSAVLVTGGFHRETVARNLASFRIARVVVTPQVTRATNREEMDGYFHTLASQGDVK